MITSMNEEEKQIYENQICELIKAANEKEIITDYKEDDNRISCKLDDDSYAIYMSGSSDPEDSMRSEKDSETVFPERAVRASRFVTRLMDKIRRDYSCYYIQYQSSHPDVSSLKSKLFGSDSGFNIIGEPKEESLLDNWNFSSFEIELEIVAAIGERYDTIIDYLTVDMDDATQQPTYTPGQMRIDTGRLLKPDDLKNASEKAVSEAKVKASKILDFILKGQLSGQEPNDDLRKNNINAMLDELSKSPTSELAKYLEEVGASNNGQIGQISVKPSALLIGADDDKRYLYKVKTQNAFEAEISLKWRSSLRSLTGRTRLYYDLTKINDNNAEVYQFVGLTNIPNDFQITDNFSSLVLAHNVDKEGNITSSGWTVKSDSLTSNSGAISISIKNYAVEVSHNGKSAYYFRDCVLKVDGKFRLECDCEKCALTGRIHYKGHLSECYFLKSSVVKKGHIYTKDKGISSFICDTCNKVIYYLEENDREDYSKTHTLLDGNGYCDQCNDIEEHGSDKYKKIDNAIYGEKRGKVYAPIMDNGDFMPIEDGGNVFVCANCGEPVFCDGKDSKVEGNKCKICDSRICSKCAGRDKEKPARPKVINENEYACKHCASSGTIITRYSKQNKLFEVDETDEDKNKCLVLDDASHPAHVFHCAACGNLKYYDSSKAEQYIKCSACGRIICSSCESRCRTGDTCFDMVFCPDCAKLCNEGYKKQKDIAEKSYTKYINYKAKIQNAESQAESTLQAHVIENIHKYLPYFKAMDKMRVRKGKRKKTLRNMITVKRLGMSVYEGKIVYKFNVRISNGSSYLFYYEDGKVTYGGVGNE